VTGKYSGVADLFELHKYLGYDMDSSMDLTSTKEELGLRFERVVWKRINNN
jgi:hypothetical protein